MVFAFAPAVKNQPEKGSPWGPLPMDPLATGLVGLRSDEQDPGALDGRVLPIPETAGSLRTGKELDPLTEK